MAKHFRHGIELLNFATAAMKLNFTRGTRRVEPAEREVEPSIDV